MSRTPSQSPRPQPPPPRPCPQGPQNSGQSTFVPLTDAPAHVLTSNPWAPAIPACLPATSWKGYDGLSEAFPLAKPSSIGSCPLCRRGQAPAPKKQQRENAPGGFPSGEFKTGMVHGHTAPHEGRRHTWPQTRHTHSRGLAGGISAVTPTPRDASLRVKELGAVKRPLHTRTAFYFRDRGVTRDGLHRSALES